MSEERVRFYMAEIVLALYHMHQMGMYVLLYMYFLVYIHCVGVDVYAVILFNLYCNAMMTLN